MRSHRRTALAFGLGLAVAAWSVTGAVRANTVLNVPNGTTDLTTLGATATSDLTFTSTAYNPTTFTIGGGATLTTGTLNSLDATQTLTINPATASTTNTLVLSGGTNSVAPNAADLLYVVAGGTLNINAGTAATNGTLGVTLGANGNFDIAGTANISAIISGAFAIEKTGAGTLSLTGQNTFTGGFTIGAGTVNIGMSGSQTQTTAFGTGTLTLGDTAIGANVVLNSIGYATQANPIVVAAGGGTRTIQGSSPTAGQIPIFSGAVTLNNTLTLTAATTTGIRMNGVISDPNATGSGIIINETNTGAIRLAGANTFNGGVTVQQGALELTNNTGAGTGTITLGLGTGTGSTTLFTSANNTVANPITVTAGNTGTATISSTGTGTGTFSGAVTLNNNLTLTATNTGALTVSGAVTGGATTTITNAGTGAGTATLSGVVSNGTGTVSITQNSATSTLALTGANTFTGPVTINAGTLSFNTAVAGATAQSLGTGTTVNLGGATAAGTLTYTSGAAAGTLDKNITLGAGGGVVGVTSTRDINLTGTLTGSSNLTVNSTGTGVTFLNGANNGNSFTGNVLVTSGQLRPGATSQLNAANTVSVNATGTVTPSFNVTNGVTIGGLNDVAGATGGSVVLNNTLTLGGTGTYAFSGVISGANTLVKSGTGTQTFSGANTYTNTTTVSGGRLVLANTTGSGTGTAAVNVNAAGATVAGTGTSTGLLTVTNGARLAPGMNTVGNFGVAGTLTLGSTGGLALTNANLDFDLSNSAAGGNDALVNGGTLTLGTLTFNFNELNGALATGTPYTLISGATTESGALTGITTTYANGANYNATYSLSGTSLQVTFAAVPEPSTWAGIVALGALGWFQRRRVLSNRMRKA